MNREEELRAIDAELAKRGLPLGGASQEEQGAPSELDLINAELARRGDTSVFTGERTWGRAGARSLKSLAAGAVGGIPNVAASVYNIPANVSNAKNEALGSLNIDPEAYARAESMGGEIPYMPYSGEVPTIPSAIDAVDKNIDEATQGYTATPEDQKYLQEGLKIVGSMGGGTAWANLVKSIGANGIAKVIEFLSSSSPRDLAGGFAAGAASEIAKEKGYSAPASAAIGLGTGAGVSSLGAALNRTTPAVAKMSGHSPKNINLEAVNAVEKTGLDYPVTLVNESKPMAMMEQITQRTPIFGAKYNKKLQEIDQSFGDQAKELTKASGKKISDSADSAEVLYDVGDALKGSLSRVKKEANLHKEALYDKARNMLPETETLIAKNTIEAIDKIRSGLKTLTPTKSEKFLLDYMNDLEGQIAVKVGQNKLGIKTPVINISDTKRSLNDMIDWEESATGVLNQLRAIRTGVTKDLADYGKNNKEWYAAYSDADSFYGKYLSDQGFASDTVKKVIAQENPEKILYSLKDVSDFKKIERSLSANPAGKGFFDSLKREKLENLILGKTFDPKTGDVVYSSFAKILEDPKNGTLIKYLAGSENYSKLKDLSQYAQAMVKRQRRNPNPSGTAYTNTALSVLTGAIIGGGGIFSMLKNTAKFAAIGSVISKIVTNKNLMNYSINAAKAQAKGDLKEAAKWSERLDKTLIDEIGESAFKQFLQLASKEAKDAQKDQQ